MKVKELLEVIKSGKKAYPNFLEWDVALEHVKNLKKDLACKGDIVKFKDFDGEWIFVKSHCMGCCTYFTKEKLFGIQIHY